MTQKDEKIIHTLRSIGEDVDSLSINDSDEWSNIYAVLEKVKKNLPKNKSAIAEVLGLCLSGLKTIIEKTTNDFLSLVSEISESLIAAEEYIKDKNEGKLPLSESRKMLEKILANDSEKNIEASENAASREKIEKMSLDGAAVALIQLEPEDAQGLIDLKESLEKIAGDGSYPESSCECVTRAAERIM
ncbi:MAG: hypothetical protein KJO26_06915, partial [Deltaproteobacteria bacterium]|nr:hypothetical protein [Deltaproteobacteria bacterium]MBT8374929.1 hypothetical protein [Deltaproteobacteria bacterium]